MDEKPVKTLEDRGYKAEIYKRGDDGSFHVQYFDRTGRSLGTEEKTANTAEQAKRGDYLVARAVERTPRRFDLRHCGGSQPRTLDWNKERTAHMLRVRPVPADR